MDAVGRTAKANYECLLFDLDDTLYPLSSGLNLACRKNIEEFMLKHLNIDEKDVPRMCLELYREHGTTMAGLKALGYEFDNDEFHAYVHGKLPYEKLKPDPVLRNLLLSMPQRKIIFTNSDQAHTVQVLSRLGLEDCFEGIVCFETLNAPPPEPIDNFDALNDNTLLAGEDQDQNLTTDVIDDNSTSSKPRILCKPSLEAIEAAIRIANIDPQRTNFFDDSARNIASGKAAGLHTVIVGASELVAGADYALSSIHNIKEAIPEIWEAEAEQLQQVIQPTSVGTAVRA
ncbi:suppressor of disruption of TFIIS-like isoform X2 [Mangifera indica]|uniref:suppressor of disruption of TFIIS-like isoform X2 n=1 Tax=Mangifera indica TaxID=29780 RepID=UPI001CF999DF|nr:suppressor of disruption of TFIIS-like isoform X2 [Mangifera indica]